jgi:cytochrome P450
MTVQNHTSYSSLHAFLTAVISFLKKEQQFADKNVQNTMFVTLQTTAPLSHVSDPHDFADAIHALYDLIIKVLHFRNQDDDKKLTDFVSSLVSCISRSKHISSDEAIDEIVSFVVQTFFKNISTDGIPDLDPR